MKKPMFVASVVFYIAGASSRWEQAAGPMKCGIISVHRHEYPWHRNEL